jgi:peptidyl-prolyl cis-trans isomerase SurA
MKTLLFTIFCIFLHFSVAQAIEQDKILAIVGGEIITSHDLENRIELVKVSGQLNLPLNEIANLKPQILQKLIDEKLIEQEAKKLDLQVNDEEIKVAIAHLESQNNLASGEFDQFLKMNHLSKEAADNQIRLSILWGKVINTRIRPKLVVSEKEMEEMLGVVVPENMEVTYKQLELPLSENPETSTEEKLLDDLTVLRSKVKNCNDFDVQAKKINAKWVPDVITVPIQRLHNELHDMVKTLPIGKASKVIKTANAFNMIVVCKRDYRGLNKEEKEEVKEMIIQKKIMLQSSYFLQDLRNKTFIEIRS